MRGVLRVGGIAQDRTGQAVRLVEVFVGEPDEFGVAETHLGDACRGTLCQLEDL